MTTRSVNVELVARVQGYLAGIKTATAATKQFAGELDQMRTKNAQGYQAVESSLLKVGAALALVTGWAVKTAMEFDKQMSEVQAITGATADEMDALRAAALKAGETTVYSATQAASAEADLAKAGLTTAQIMGGGLAGALSLAAAGSLDLDEAANTAANTMNEFGLKAGDVGHIADVLAGAANATTADVHGLALALSMGGGAAHAAGMSLEDTLTALGALSKAAINGSDAGTSLKTMLLQLEGPSKKAADLMATYGFSVYDASGNMVNLYTMADRLQTSFGGLTQAQRNAAFATIFGNDAVRSANALYIQGSAGLRQINKDMLAQADAAKVAAEKTDNLAGDLKRLKGSLDALLITSGEGANGGLRLIAQALGSLTTQFSDLPDSVQSAVVILAGVTGAALLAAAAFLKVRTSVAATAAALAAAGPVAARFGTALTTLAGVAGKVTVAFAGLEIAGSVIRSNFGYDASTNVDDLSNALLGLAKNGQDASKTIQDSMGHIDYDLQTLRDDFYGKLSKGEAGAVEGATGLGSVFDESLEHARQRITAIDAALAQMVQSGHGDEAAKIFDSLADSAGKGQITLEELRAGFPGYTKAYTEFTKQTGAGFGQLDTAWQKVNGGADALNQLGGAAGSEAAIAEQTRQANIRMAGAFGEAASALGGLKAKFDQMNGGAIGWLQAESNVEQAADDLRDSFHQNGTTLDSNTQKGRDNTGALIRYVEATRDAMQAKMDETHSVQDADAVYEHYKTTLYNLARQAGLTKDQARGLVDELLQMPSTKNIDFVVTVHTRGLTSVQNSLSKLGHMAEANGGMVDYYASGGENHTAQIAPAGAMRVWAEPETGGEAYIPLSAAKRGRSMEILSDVARRFNMAVTPRIDHRALASALAGQQSGPSAAAIGHAVRAALAGVTVVMDGRAVGTVQGRQADVLGRTF